MAVESNDRRACRHSAMAGGIQDHQAARIIGGRESGEIPAELDRWESELTTEVPNNLTGPKILGLSNHLEEIPHSKQTKALGMSTLAFAVCFAVWTIFSIIGLRLKDELGLDETEFGLLVGTPILTGSISRILLGIWTDQYGGRIVYVAVMLCAAVATYLLSHADTYAMVLIAGLGLGLAGGSFAAGVAYVSKWYP